MIIHDVQQGSQEWLALRAAHCCASEAAAMLGICNKTTRTELIRMKATGDGKEFSDWVQTNLLDRGHAVEALARPHAEALLNEELYPVVGTEVIEGVPVLASYDGLTMMEDKAFEHKQPNKDLIAYIKDFNDLPDSHWPQAEQQLLVMGNKPGDYVLFTVSDGTAENAVRLEYRSRPDRQARLIPGWQQFLKDVADFTPSEIKPEAVAAPIKQLPELAIHIKGDVTHTNFPEWKEIVVERIDQIKTDLVTDQDFADAAKMVTFLDAGEKKIAMVKAQAQAQAISIDEAFRALDEISAVMRTKRLELNKLVETEKKNRKAEIMQRGKDKLKEHIDAINAELGKVSLPAIPADFNAAIARLSSLESIENAVATCLANAKIAADAEAKKVRFNLVTFEEIAATDFAFLFLDLQTLVVKEPGDFTAVIKQRIADHKQAEQEKKDRETAEAARRTEADTPKAAEEKTQLSHDHKAETSGTATAAPASSNVSPIRSGGGGTARQTDDDLRVQISGYLTQMDRQQLNLVAMFCRDKLAA